MANIKLIFQGSSESETYQSELMCHANVLDNIYISICDTESNNLVDISLDIPTAIKFAKTIRTEINKIKS